MRKGRVLKHAAMYHVIAKTNRGEDELKEEKVKELFEKVLFASKQKYSFELINYTIMNNHIHLMIRPLGDSSLSDIMRWILSVFAMRYNKMCKKVGSFWRSRFFSKIVEGRSYLQTCFAYITENPVAKKMVSRCSEFRYGAIFWILKEVYEYIEKPDPIYENILKKYF